MYCKVVFDVPLDRDFDYLVPDELAAKAVPGVRVTAPFGRILTGGMIVSVSEVRTAPEDMKLKEIVSVVDERPLFLDCFRDQWWWYTPALFLCRDRPGRHVVEVETKAEKNAKSAGFGCHLTGLLVSE